MNQPQNFFIIGCNCPCCEEDFKAGEVIMALGQPFHCLVHNRCKYIFPYHKGWPHKEPLDSYKFYTEVLENKLNLDRSNFLRNSGNNVKTVSRSNSS